MLNTRSESGPKIDLEMLFKSFVDNKINNEIRIPLAKHFEFIILNEEKTTHHNQIRMPIVVVAVHK